MLGIKFNENPLRPLEQKSANHPFLRKFTFNKMLFYPPTHGWHCPTHKVAV
jgi:hypothetical protein